MNTKPDKVEKTIKVLGNFIFVPLLVFILFNAIFMLKAKGNHEVPALYGYSVINVTSTNMQPNFKKDSLVVVKSIPTSKLNVGNYIAYYDYERKDVDKAELEANVGEVTQQDNEKSNADIKELSFVNFLGGGATNIYQKSVAKQTDVVFKKITKISTITNPTSSFCGKRFFYTTGIDSDTDGKWIMEDYVVGRYQKSSGLMGLLIKVFSNSVGNIIILVVPSLILLFMVGKVIYIEFKKYLKSDDGDFDEEDDDFDDVKEHKFKIRLKPKNQNKKIKDDAKLNDKNREK